MSKKKRLQIQDEKDVRAAYRSAHPYCEGHRAGAPGECLMWTGLSIHEPWSRGRGGPTDDPRNMRVVDFELNRKISQDRDTMEWALANDYLVHREDGPAWLEQTRHSCASVSCHFKEA